MFPQLALLLLVPQSATLSDGESCAEYIIVERWNNGWKGNLNIPIPKATKSWRIHATFDSEIVAGDFWAGQKQWFTLRSPPEVHVIGNDWSAKQAAGTVFKTGFTVNYPEHGPDVNFATLEITLCWRDEPGCSTCSPLVHVVECNGSLNLIEDGSDGNPKSGQISVVSQECYDHTPNITLTFSQEVDTSKIQVSEELTAYCSDTNCTLTSEVARGINDLIVVNITYPSDNTITGIATANKDLCDVPPEYLELTLPPTRVPVSTEPAVPTPDRGTLEGCGEYEITEVWRNGWKGFVHINIPFPTKQWKLAARFTKPVQSGDFIAGLPEQWYPNQAKKWMVVVGSGTMDWSAKQKEGTVFRLEYNFNHREEPVNKKTHRINELKVRLMRNNGVFDDWCYIVKKECSNPNLQLTPVISRNREGKKDKSVAYGMFIAHIDTCVDDLPPLTIEFSASVKRITVPAGRFKSTGDKHICTITSAVQMKIAAATTIHIKFTVQFWSKDGGIIVGLNQGDKNVCFA